MFSSNYSHVKIVSYYSPSHSSTLKGISNRILKRKGPFMFLYLVQLVLRNENF